MSFAVHDSQAGWSDNMYNTKKRRRGLGVSKSVNISGTDESRDQSSEMNKASWSHFLIDGIAPVNARPQLLARKTEKAANEPGRHRSVDIKGLIMELIDEIYPPLVCPICLYISAARSEADLHLKTEHQGNKAFQCMHTHCSQSYSSKPGLRYHLEHAHNVTSTEESLKRFDRISSISSTSTSLSSSTTAEAVKNNYDNTTTSNHKKYKKHALSPELQQKLDEIYSVTECPSCHKEFKRKTHVIRHLVDVHHGEEPYKCIVSDCKRTKTYATREGLLYHLVSYHD